MNLIFVVLQSWSILRSLAAPIQLRATRSTQRRPLGHRSVVTATARRPRTGLKADTGLGKSTKPLLRQRPSLSPLISTEARRRPANLVPRETSTPVTILIRMPHPVPILILTSIPIVTKFNRRRGDPACLKLAPNRRKPKLAGSCHRRLIAIARGRNFRNTMTRPAIGTALLVHGRVNIPTPKWSLTRCPSIGVIAIARRTSTSIAIVVAPGTPRIMERTRFRGV